jgi:hypothetical protein
MVAGGHGVRPAKRLIPLGSIHTHTYRKGVSAFDEVQSLGGLATWDTLDRITGIAHVA